LALVRVSALTLALVLALTLVLGVLVLALEFEVDFPHIDPNRGGCVDMGKVGAWSRGVVAWRSGVAWWRGGGMPQQDGAVARRAATR